MIGVELEEMVRRMIVEGDVKREEVYVEMKKGLKEYRLNERYGDDNRKFRNRMKLMVELGVVKGNGWEFWKNEISGEKGIDDVKVDVKGLNKILMERREDKVIDWSVVNRKKDNVCLNCLEEKCKMDRVSSYGFMMVGRCDKKFEIDMGVDVDEVMIEIDRDRMWRDVRVKEIEEVRERVEEYKRKWNSGEYLKEWRLKRGKRIDVLMDWRGVKKEMIKRGVKRLGYEEVLMYRKMEFEKLGLLKEKVI